MDCLYEVWNKKKWSSPKFDKEMLEWVYLLLNAVDITSDKAMTYLKEFVSPSAHVVTTKYNKQIVKQVWLGYSKACYLINTTKGERSSFTCTCTPNIVTQTRMYMQLGCHPSNLLCLLHCCHEHDHHRPLVSPHQPRLVHLMDKLNAMYMFHAIYNFMQFQNCSVFIITCEIGNCAVQCGRDKRINYQWHYHFQLSSFSLCQSEWAKC